MLEPGVELTGSLVPRKQEHPLNSALGFSVQWDTNVGVEVVPVIVSGTVRLNWTVSSRAATVVVAVTVAVLCRTKVSPYTSSDY
jgi:hypothetical protein